MPNWRGSHDLSLQIVNKRGKEFYRMELGEPKVCKPGQKMDMYCQISGIEVPTYGDYQIILHSGKKKIGEPLALPVVNAVVESGPRDE